MKMKSYVATDMRSAMRQVREELGPDAVILSTRQVSDGVELSAAIDHEQALEQNWNEEMALRFAAAAREEAAAALQQEQAAASHEARVHEAMNSDVSEELKSLRQLLEQQLAALAWNDYTRREPQRAQALQTLTTIGLARDIARIIADELPEQLDAEQAQRIALAMLARSIAVCPDPSADGGVLALIGPPGSGKTTTLAKLAVRWLLEQPQGSLTLVSTDEERIGSHEQLRALGRLLGVPVHIAANAAELAELLEVLEENQPDNQRLILIDTAGVAARDQAGIATLGHLCAVSAKLRTLLVLPASSQGGVLEETLSQYSRIEPACAVLTRVDEAALLGGALSALVRSQLPLALISEGPGIPEDLRPARSHQLVARAVELSRNANQSADEDLLAHRYGGGRDVAA